MFSCGQVVLTFVRSVYEFESMDSSLLPARHFAPTRKKKKERREESGKQ